LNKIIKKLQGKDDKKIRLKLQRGEQTIKAEFRLKNFFKQ